MKKVLLVIGVVVVLAVLALVFGRNILARMVVIDGIKKTCGLKVDIAGVDISLPKVRVLGLKIYNPDGFADRLLADIPEISLDMDLAGVLKNKVHIKMLTLNVRELDLAINEQGKLNVNSLALLVPPKGTGTPPEVKIDTLFVKIGKVSYKGAVPGVNSAEYQANIEETFHDVTDPAKITGQIMGRIVSRVGIASFSDFAAKGDIKDVVDGLKNIFKGK